MNLLLADAIDFPLVFMYGMAVLIPLMLFQVGIEALILRFIWRVPFRQLSGFAFRANCWSLVAGIPTKILNAIIYSVLLPPDIPTFFGRYPLAVGVGTLIYFVATVLVELVCAFRWSRTNDYSLTQRKMLGGVLFANIVTYAVLAPLHYFATRPTSDIRQFSKDTLWSSHPETKVLYTTPESGHLKMIRLGGTVPETIVSAPVKDYLVSSDLNICLFRGNDGNLALWRRDSGKSIQVWRTKERFLMNQVAFSPTARHVAFASEKDCSLEVVELPGGRRTSHELPAGAKNLSVAWSTEDSKFYATHSGNRFTATITPTFSLSLEPMETTNQPALFISYGRVGPASWYGGGDWGQSYGNDKCGELQAWAMPGLGSRLIVSRQGGARAGVFALAVNPGLLHLSAISFGDVSFLPNCQELVFEAGNNIYLVDVQKKRLGTVAEGERFVLFTERYRKHL